MNYYKTNRRLYRAYNHQQGAVNRRALYGLITVGIIGAFFVSLEILGITNLAKANESSAVQSASTMNYPTLNNSQKESAPVEVETGTTDVIATITRVSQSNEGIVQVRLVIENAKSGTCKLRFTKKGLATGISKAAPVNYNGTSYTCDGFDIPTSEFPEPGNWDLAVEVINDKGVSKIATQSVSITK